MGAVACALVRAAWRLVSTRCPRASQISCAKPCVEMSLDAARTSAYATSANTLLAQWHSKLTALRLAASIAFVDIDVHAEERGAQRLALCVHPQRDRAPAAQRLVQQEIQGAQVGQLEALHFALHQRAEELLDPLRRDLSDQRRIIAPAPG